MMFPWLSRIATRYERFQFHSLECELITSQPTTVAGRVYMAIDYDYADAPATSAVGMMSNRTAVEGPLWSNLRLRADPKELHPDMPWKYCNAVSRGNYVEPRTAFSGYLMVAASGVNFDPSPNVDLWVTYDVTLRIPVVEANEEGSVTGNTRVGNFPEIIGASLTGHVPLLNTAANALVPMLQCGAGGVPEMVYADAQMPRCFDLSRAVSAGLDNVSFTTVAKKTGVTPASLLSSLGGVRPVFPAYTAEGYFIGTWNTSDDGLFSAVGDPVETSQSNWATAGGDLRLLATTSLSKIVQAWPSARYLVPLWKSGFSIGDVVQGSRMKWEL